MVKIAVLISGSGTNLQALLDAQKDKLFNGEIKLVISNKKNAYGLERAKLAGIEALWIKDEKILLKTLKEKEIDLIVLAGYLAIISNEFIESYNHKIINIHPSLIPAFCGKGYYGIHVHQEAFKRGVKISGATVHFVTNDIDGGPIILQRAIDISDCGTPEQIQEKILYNIEHKILVEAVKLYCDKKIVIDNERVRII